MENNINKIATQVDSFPALPSIVTQVLSITADPESSANDLMEAILPDQTMCAAILKVANSAFYGLPREIGTIEKAVVVLGQEEVKNIVIGKAIFASFPKMKQEYRAQIGLFWEHAFTCGLASRIIATQFNMPASEFFIAGLIHDIGKIAMLLAFPNNYDLLHQFSRSPRTFDTDDEKSNFSVSHDRVGHQLAKRWLLPEKLVMAIGFHHSPQDAPHNMRYPLIVQAANMLALLYDSSDISTASDVAKIFTDCLPEIENIWDTCELTWKSENVGLWFEKLRQLREEEQSIFQMFSS